MTLNKINEMRTELRNGTREPRRETSVGDRVMELAEMAETAEMADLRLETAVSPSAL